jgi:hypothetical protein
MDKSDAFSGYNYLQDQQYSRWYGLRVNKKLDMASIPVAKGSICVDEEDLKP